MIRSTEEVQLIGRIENQTGTDVARLGSGSTHGAPMTDNKDEPARDSESARDAKHPREQGNTSDRGATGAGQEATNNAPADHSHEHQSEYGGGGANGGASKS
jgi:hypothetical protein